MQAIRRFSQRLLPKGNQLIASNFKVPVAPMPREFHKKGFLIKSLTDVLQKKEELFLRIPATMWKTPFLMPTTESPILRSVKQYLKSTNESLNPHPVDSCLMPTNKNFIIKESSLDPTVVQTLTLVEKMMKSVAAFAIMMLFIILRKPSVDAAGEKRKAQDETASNKRKVIDFEEDEEYEKWLCTMDTDTDNTLDIALTNSIWQSAREKMETMDYHESFDYVGWKYSRESAEKIQKILDKLENVNYKLDDLTAARGDCFVVSILQQINQPLNTQYFDHEIVEIASSFETANFRKKVAEFANSDHTLMVQIKNDYPVENGFTWSDFWDRMTQNGRDCEYLFMLSSAIMLDVDICTVSTRSTVLHPFSSLLVNHKNNPNRPTFVLGYIESKHFQSLVKEMSDTQMCIENMDGCWSSGENDQATSNNETIINDITFEHSPCLSCQLLRPSQHLIPHLKKNENIKCKEFYANLYDLALDCDVGEIKAKRDASVRRRKPSRNTEKRKGEKRKRGVSI